MFLGLELGTLILTLLGYILGAGGLVFWFLERKKFNAEVESLLIDSDSSKISNKEQLLKHHQDLVNDIDKSYNLRYELFVKLTEDKEKMYEDNFKTFEEMMSTKTRMLKSEVDLLKKKVTMLREELKEKELQIKAKDAIIEKLKMNTKLIG